MMILIKYALHSYNLKENKVCNAFCNFVFRTLNRNSGIVSGSSEEVFYSTRSDQGKETKGLVLYTFL